MEYTELKPNQKNKNFFTLKKGINLTANNVVEILKELKEKQSGNMALLYDCVILIAEGARK